MPAGSRGAVRVIVTRPAHDAQHWVSQLQQAGFDAEVLPLIEIAPASAASDIQALQQAWQVLDSYAACMFVSGNAVEYFFKPKMPLAPAEPAQSAINNVASNIVANGAPAGVPPGLRFMAPGPGTAAALLAAGVPASQIDAPPADALQFDSQALWKVVGQRDWQGCRVLVVRGSSIGTLSHAAGEAGVTSGRDWLTRQLQAAGAEVDALSVYERRAPLLSGAGLERARAASADGSVWLFSSSEAVANLTGAPGMSVADWGSARAIATHPRIAMSLRSAAWGVVVESRPALKDILDTLRSIESGYP
jgi:uroporphyrinogen-III synthase